MGWLPKLFLLLIIALTLAWSAMVLTVELTLRQHKEIFSSLGEAAPEKRQGGDSELLAVYGDLTWLHENVPCYGKFRQQAALVASVLAGRALEAGDISSHERYLDSAKFYISEHLLCAPRDGKAWLDYVVIKTEIEGFSDAALAAWKRSANVTPHEGWLVEKRLRMAMFFFTLLDEEAKSMMWKDIQTLREGYRSRHRRILAYGGFDSLDALEANYFPENAEKMAN